MAEKIAHLEKKSLKRVLGISDLFAVGYGDVGSSIYYALGVTVLYALGAAPIALGVAGVIFICTALTYAELSTTFPEAGGSATYTRHAFNDVISFAAGWALLLDYVVTTAIAAYAIPSYMRQVLNLLHIPYDASVVVHLTATVLIIGGLFLLNVWGVKESGRFTLLLTMFTIVTQGLIIVIGAFFFLNAPYIWSHMRIGVAGVTWSPDWANFFKGTAMAMVAYTGIEAMSQMAAETKNPGLIIPRAIRRVVGVVLFLCAGLSTIGLSVVSPQELSTTYLEDPIAGIVSNFPIGGEILAPWVGLIAALILLACANTGLLGSSRLLFSMGEVYQIPKVFYRLHKKFRTPHVSLAFFAILSSLIALLSQGRLLVLADIYNLGAQLTFFLTHLSLIILRVKQPGLLRPYRAPLNIPIGKGRSIPITAVLGAIATFAIWILIVLTKEEGRLLGLLWFVMGLAMFYYYRRKKKLVMTGRLEIQKVKIPGYVPMNVKDILAIIRSENHVQTLETACQLAKVYKAKLHLTYVLEIPPSMPMDAPMEKKEELAEASIKRAEAIAREYNVDFNLQILRSRSLDRALLTLLQQGGQEMVVLGAESGELSHWSHFTQKLDREGTLPFCKWIICKN